MNQEEGNELLAFNARFKKAILDVLFSVCETFYIHCLPHSGLVMGKRGLLDREKEEGIILVFGPYSTRGLSWDDAHIYCEMQFNAWERLTIPYGCIARMFDKTGQVLMHWNTFDQIEAGARKENGSVGEARPDKEKEKVIEVDFSRKKKDKKT
ncbi:MAG: stringent starvation protein B [Spirochaetales bacterium]|nr:stringent starvation protein B [Spirochaetales bacterium]